MAKPAPGKAVADQSCTECVIVVLRLDVWLDFVSVTDLRCLKLGHESLSEVSGRSGSQLSKHVVFEVTVGGEQLANVKAGVDRFQIEHRRSALAVAADTDTKLSPVKTKS